MSWFSKEAEHFRPLMDLTGSDKAQILGTTPSKLIANNGELYQDHICSLNMCLHISTS